MQSFINNFKHKSKHWLLRDGAFLKCALNEHCSLLGWPRVQRLLQYHVLCFLTQARESVSQRQAELCHRGFASASDSRKDVAKPTATLVETALWSPVTARLGPRAVLRAKHSAITWNQLTEQETPSRRYHKDKVDF